MEMLLMRTQIKINGELKDVEIENGEITIIEPGETTGWERKKDSEYCYWCGDDRVDKLKENYSTTDNNLYRLANYFSSEELFKNISRMQTLQRQMFRWQAENDVILTSKYRWCIIYDTDYGEIVPTETRANAGFLPVFSCKEKAEECIKVFKNELTWLFTEFGWRMDG